MSSAVQETNSKSSQPADGDQSTRTRVVRQTALLTALSVLSPTLGLIGEAALAWRFGTTGIVDAYRITVLLLLYGQQLFVGSILPYVLVPIFAECRSRGCEEEAWAVADSVARILLLFGISISTLLFFRPDLGINLIAPGLTGHARETAIYFMHWCGLGFLPICWTGAACGILFAYDVIQVGALAQLTSNLVMALAIILIGGKMGPNSLIIGVLGGAVGSTAICTYKLNQIRRKFGPTHRAAIRVKLLWQAAGLAAPLLVAIIVGQSTSVVVNRTLSFLAVGSLASFGYAVKMGMLVQLAPNAMTTVLFPKLSANWFSKDKSTFGPVCAKGIRAALFISLPLTCICYVGQTAIVAILLGRGAFHGTDVRTAGILFGLMIIGAPASTVVVSLSRAFYAAQQTKFPVITDICGNLCEIAFIPILAMHFGLSGVAFAYMLLPWMTGSGLLILFIRRYQSFPTGDFVTFTAKIVAVVLACGWIAGKVAHLASDGIEPVFLRSVVMVTVTAAVVLSGYLAGTLAWGIQEASSVREFVQRLVGNTRFNSLPATQ